MGLLDLWPYAAGYAVVIAAFNSAVLSARPHWRGWRLICVSASIGPIAVAIIALAIISAPGAGDFTRLFVSFFAFIAFIASLVIGGLVSLGVSSWLTHAIEQERRESETR